MVSSKAKGCPLVAEHRHQTEHGRGRTEGRRQADKHKEKGQEKREQQAKVTEVSRGHWDGEAK
jgi:hypothetical protein